MADPEHIVVIADSTEAQAAIARALRDAGFEVQTPDRCDGSNRVHVESCAAVVMNAGCDALAKGEILVRSDAQPEIKSTSTPPTIGSLAADAPEAGLPSDILEQITNNIATHLAYLDPEFNFVWVNSTYADKSGYSKDELLGRNHFELFPNEENQRIFECVRDTGQPYTVLAKPFECPNHPERGVTYWDWMLTPLKKASGEIEGLILSLQDVTDETRARMEVEEQRAEAEKRLAELNAIFAALSDPAVAYDALGNPIRINAAAKEAYGFDPVNMDRNQIHRVLSMCHPDGRMAELDELPSSRALRGENVKGQRLIFTDARGRDLLVEASASPLMLDGEVVGAVAVWHDISELNRLVVDHRRQRDFLERLVNGAPVGIAVVRGSEYRFELVNPYYQSIAGGDVPMIGRRFQDVFPAAAETGGLDRLGRVYHTGQPISIREHEIQVRPEETDPRYWDVDYVPLPGLTGSVEGILILTREVTSQVLARRQTEAIVQSLVDGLIITDAEGNILEMNAAALDIHGFTSYSDIPLHAEQLYKLTSPAYPDGGLIPIDSSPLYRALRGETFSGMEVRSKRLDNGDECVARYSGTAVRNDSGQVVLAVLTLHDVTDRKRAEMEAKAAREILEEAYKREHRIADVLQRVLAPKMDIDIPGYSLAARYEPARQESDVGGDFYDLFKLGDGRVAIVMGDVSGKGLGAAVHTAMAKYIIRAYAYEDPEPKQVMQRVNDAMSNYVLGERFVTVFYSVLDPASHTLVYADAGHEQPVFYWRSEGTISRLSVTGRVVGIMAGGEYRQKTLQFEQGDILLIYTDGISEAGPHYCLLGIDGVAEALCENVNQPSQQIADIVVDSAMRAAGGILRDDAAVLVLKADGLE